MPETAKKQVKSRVPLYVAAGFAAVLVGLHFLQIFSGLDHKFTDELFVMRGMEGGDPRIVIVTIDDESIKKLGQYPWPRSVYTKLLDRLFAEGVKVVGLDILFPDPSRPDEDQALIRVTRKWGGRLVHSIDLVPEIHDKNVFRYPFAALREAAKSQGVVNQTEIDSDGMVRRSYLMIGTAMGEGPEWPKDPKAMPSLAVKVLSAFEGKQPLDYLKDRRNLIELNFRGQDERPAPVKARDEKGNIIPITIDVFGLRRIAAWKLLAPKPDPRKVARGEASETLDAKEKAALKGGIVLVGSTAVGAFDHFPSPFTKLAPGVEVHANIIDNMLNDRGMRSLPESATYLFVAAFAFLAAWTVTLSPLAAAGITAAVFAGWLVASIVLFSQLVLVEFTAPTLALLGPFGVLLVRKTLAEQREKRYIKQTFGQYLSPKVVEILVNDPTRAKLGGDKRDLTVFFLDIAHFTNISEKMTPEALTHFLNEYLTALSNIILKYEGTLDKYIGDCIMAFWNAPLDQTDHRARACMAAVECQQIIAELNKNLDPNLPEKPAVRIGLNSGAAVVGNMGSVQRLTYTVIGDEVNLASRLEGANKFFGSKIMASEGCYEGAKDSVEARELGRVRVVGKAIPIRVYELLGKKGILSDGWAKALPLYNRGVELFNKRDFQGSKKAFAEVLKLVPGDGPSKLYLSASEDYSQIAPPGDWDGVFNLTTK